MMPRPTSFVTLALCRAAALLGACWLALPPAMAATGDADAQFALAVRYEHAEGVPRDYARALELYCSAVDQGHIDAAVKIAWIYLNGRGVMRDDAVGAAWLRLAAERGHAFAARLLDRLGAVPKVKPAGCREPEPAPIRNRSQAGPCGHRHRIGVSDRCGVAAQRRRPDAADARDGAALRRQERL